jgi:hypothetical protein
MRNEDVLALIIELRGGVPDTCDFCGEAFSEERWPIPEEAGAWACSVCWTRWEAEDHERQAPR